MVARTWGEADLAIHVAASYLTLLGAFNLMDYSTYLKAFYGPGLIVTSYCAVSSGVLVSTPLRMIARHIRGNPGISPGSSPSDKSIWPFSINSATLIRPG